MTPTAQLTALGQNRWLDPTTRMLPSSGGLQTARAASFVASWNASMGAITSKSVALAAAA